MRFVHDIYAQYAVVVRARTWICVVYSFHPERDYFILSMTIHPTAQHVVKVGFAKGPIACVVAVEY